MRKLYVWPVFIIVVILAGAFILHEWLGSNTKERIEKNAEEFECGYVEPSPSAIRSMAAVAALPVVGNKRVLIVNGSTSQFDSDIGPFWTKLSDGQIAFTSNGISGSFAQSCVVTDDARSAVAALDDRVNWTEYQYLIIYDTGISCGVQQGQGNVTFQTNDGTVTLGIAR